MRGRVSPGRQLRRLLKSCMEGVPVAVERALVVVRELSPVHGGIVVMLVGEAAA